MSRIKGMERKTPYLDGPLRQVIAVPAKRPISERRLAANRRNATLSTGPRTIRGKARAALNAYKHGVLARGLVIPRIEGKAAARQFNTMLKALIADLCPVGALERLMVQEIAVCTWRLRRILKYENRAAYLHSLDWQPSESPLEELRGALLGEHWQQRESMRDKALERSGLNDMSLAEPGEVTTISRYENSLMRHLYRAIDHLERIQRRRRSLEGISGTEIADRSETARGIFENPRREFPSR